MGITTENRKRRVDTAGYIQPTEAWHGKTWFDYNTNRLKIYDSNIPAWVSEEEITWYVFRTSDVVGASGGAYVHPAAPSAAPVLGDRGVFSGGYAGSYRNTISYITISTTGDATDFGDLTQARGRFGGASNGSNDRGVNAGGAAGFGGSAFQNTMDYVTISSEGNATDFGDLAQEKYGTTGTSNLASDRGVIAGGLRAAGYAGWIENFTISTTGNAVKYGDLTLARNYCGATSNGTNDRGVFVGGVRTSRYNIIEYITISTGGAAIDFGDLTVTADGHEGVSNATNDRGVFYGNLGSITTDNIDYITISSTGNATDFGDSTVGRYLSGSLSNGINDRGVWGAGYNVNTIDYVTISTTGNAVDFGDANGHGYGVVGYSNT